MLVRYTKDEPCAAYHFDTEEAALDEDGGIGAPGGEVAVGEAERFPGG